MSELSPILQQKLLERYLKLVEANHKTSDYALERNRQLDDVKQEQKRLSSLLKSERSNLRKRSQELEQSNQLLLEERELRARIELDHQKSADYIEELEKVNSNTVDELDARIVDLRALQENFDSQSSELQKLSDYILVLEERSNVQAQEITKLGKYVTLLESRSDSQIDIIDQLKDECETARNEHQKLIELAEKHSELVKFSQQKNYARHISTSAIVETLNLSIPADIWIRITSSILWVLTWGRRRFGPRHKSIMRSTFCSTTQGRTNRAGEATRSRPWIAHRSYMTAYNGLTSRIISISTAIPPGRVLEGRALRAPTPASAP